MTTKRETEWCWREKGSERAQGPFVSREEAIEDARSQSDSGKVWVGNCSYPDPSSTAASLADLDDMLEKMEERAYEDQFAFDDTVFDLKIERSKAAQEALAKALGDWAEEYIDPTSMWSSDNEELVIINPEADDEA